MCNRGAVDLPSDVLVEICAASPELTWLTGASDIPLDVINEMRFLTTRDARPSVNYDQGSWVYARAFEDHAMSEGR